MGRLVHFEVPVDDMDRAKKFYSDVLGWTYEDYTDYVGEPYFGAITGDEKEPGINGALMMRQGSKPEGDQAFNGYLCTMEVEDYDLVHNKILSSGGRVAVPKHPLPGMAWQGYYYDTEGNKFGIHQPDENAK